MGVRIHILSQILYVGGFKPSHSIELDGNQTSKKKHLIAPSLKATSNPQIAKSVPATWEIRGMSFAITGRLLTRATPSPHGDANFHDLNPCFRIIESDYYSRRVKG
jgi:hypothetical protein